LPFFVLDDHHEFHLYAPFLFCVFVLRAELPAFTAARGTLLYSWALSTRRTRPAEIDTLQ
jgi:hypothetical protein